MLSRRLRLLGGALVVSFVASILVASPAAADLCAVYENGQAVGFEDCDKQGGTDGSTGNGPSCEILPGDNGCYLGKSCQINDPAVNDEEDVTGYMPPKPGDDYHAAWRSCDGMRAEWYWSRDDGPSTAELAMIAYGQLPFPDVTPTYNPPGRTLVNLETWWWSGTATGGVLTATAGSVTATATPDRMEVDPGDGSGVKSCAFSTTRSDVCSTVYRKSRASGYTARMRLIWTVAFDDGGTPVEGAGIPTDFTSAWSEVVVPVYEVQSRVTKSGR